MPKASASSSRRALARLKNGRKPPQESDDPVKLKADFKQMLQTNLVDLEEIMQIRRGHLQKMQDMQDGKLIPEASRGHPLTHSRL